jgi:uncharacterized protein YndB with AHSA1/START domain
VSDILQDLPIRAPADAVFKAISDPAGLDQWWAEQSSGTPREGEEYSLGFGPDYQWRARVARYRTNSEFELELTVADADWTGTRVRFVLEARGETTWLRFSHYGWPEANEHYRISCHCWAMYLRVLRRYLEFGETVPYAERLSV